MANNKYENQFCFVASSTIISNCLFSDCIIAIYKVSSMSNNKVTFIHQLEFDIVTQEVGPVFLKSGLK